MFRRGKNPNEKTVGLQAIAESPGASFTEHTYSPWLRMLPGPRPKKHCFLLGCMSKSKSMTPSLPCKHSKTKQIYGNAQVHSVFAVALRDTEGSWARSRPASMAGLKGFPLEDGAVKNFPFNKTSTVQNNDGSVHFLRLYLNNNWKHPKIPAKSASNSSTVQSTIQLLEPKL